MPMLGGTTYTGPAAADCLGRGWRARSIVQNERQCPPSAGPGDSPTMDDAGRYDVGLAGAKPVADLLSLCQCPPNAA